MSVVKSSVIKMKDIYSHFFLNCFCSVTYIFVLKIHAYKKNARSECRENWNGSLKFEFCVMPIRVSRARCAWASAASKSELWHCPMLGRGSSVFSSPVSLISFKDCSHDHRVSDSFQNPNSAVQRIPVHNIWTTKWIFKAGRLTEL